MGGIVVMRYGENALDVIDRVKTRLKEVEGSLPEGVKLVVTYDRSELILRAIDTLKEKLTQEMIVVSVVIIVFLLHLRSAFIPILALSLAVIISFIPMFYMKLTANIMSLGGIAIAIGATGTNRSKISSWSRWQPMAKAHRFSSEIWEPSSTDRICAEALQNWMVEEKWWAVSSSCAMGRTRSTSSIGSRPGWRKWRVLYRRA